MTEQLQEIEIASLPFEDRADLFRGEVNRIAATVGGCEEKILNKYGEKVALFHFANYETERQWWQREIDKILLDLGKSVNPKAPEGISQIDKAKDKFFKKEITAP